MTEARKPESAIVQAPLAQLPWYHHLTLMDKLNSPRDWLWYAGKVVEHGWSRLTAAVDELTRDRLLPPPLPGQVELPVRTNPKTGGQTL